MLISISCLLQARLFRRNACRLRPGLPLAVELPVLLPRRPLPLDTRGPSRGCSRSWRKPPPQQQPHLHGGPPALQPHQPSYTQGSTGGGHISPNTERWCGGRVLMLAQCLIHGWVLQLWIRQHEQINPNFTEFLCAVKFELNFFLNLSND